MYNIIRTAQRSAVATTNADITRPFDATHGMAEVVLGAGSGTVSVQFKGSNDGTIYTDIGSAVTATTRNVSLATSTTVYQYYRAECVISTNTKVVDITFYFV
jgi:hypothetical protein